MQIQSNQLLSVLVVEDDPDAADFFESILSDDCLVECVGNVPAALASLERCRPDVIVLDCVLPGDAVGDVLERAETLNCAVVLTSGAPGVLDQLAVLHRYPRLQKPFLAAELCDAIQTALVQRCR